MTTARTRKKATASEAPATTPEPEPEQVLATVPTTEDIEVVNPSEVKETGAQPEDGSVTLVYRGMADVFEHGSFRIRPGQPVTVPSDVAEELLTYPRERFERISQE